MADTDTTRAGLVTGGANGLGAAVAIALTARGMAQAVCWLALGVPDDITAERLNASGGINKN